MLDNNNNNNNNCYVFIPNSLYLLLFLIHSMFKNNLIILDFERSDGCVLLLSSTLRGT